MTRFSVLLPTRNGGHYLHDCISSVLDQGYDDLELVVSDNANTDETAAIVALFGDDSRFTSIRLEQPVSVTENWRTALEASRGDYILMIGDDDYVLPGYFERMAKILDRYDQPECVGYNAYGYVFPDSIGNESSYYTKRLFNFGPDFREGLVPRETRISIVRDMFRFRVRYPLTMQQTLVSRRVANRIHGGMFQPPFPDCYAVSALLLEAETLVYHPGQEMVIGVSPKSFHHFFINDQQNQGMSYLGENADFVGRLPGNEQVNAMHVWLEKLRQDFPAQLGELAVSRADYVRYQVYAWYLQLRSGALTPRALLDRCRRLTLRDWQYLAAAPLDGPSRERLLRRGRRRRADHVQARWQALERLEGVENIRQFAAATASLT